MKALSSSAYDMDAPAGGVDAMASEDYAGGASFLLIEDRFELRSERKIDERSSGWVCAGTGDTVC
jgi:hypothetical protein